MSRARTLAESVSCAIQGIAYAWQTQRNMRLLTAAGLLVLAAAWVCRLSALEWLLLLGALFVLLFAEMMNTALEIFVDHWTGGAYRAEIKRMKDVAAGAVLMTALNAAVVSLVVFLPRVLSLLRNR